MYEGTPVGVLAAAADGDQVVVLLGATEPINGDSWVSYAPPPFDVIGKNGLDAPAFTEFPIT